MSLFAALYAIDLTVFATIFEVKDAGGAETAAVVISLDGKPWLPSLDGKAQAIDPGPHLLRFAVAPRETQWESRRLPRELAPGRLGARGRAL